MSRLISGMAEVTTALDQRAAAGIQQLLEVSKAVLIVPGRIKAVPQDDGTAKIAHMGISSSGQRTPRIHLRGVCVL